MHINKEQFKCAENFYTNKTLLQNLIKKKMISVKKNCYFVFTCNTDL